MTHDSTDSTLKQDAAAGVSIGPGGRWSPLLQSRAGLIMGIIFSLLFFVVVYRVLLTPLVELVPRSSSDSKSFKLTLVYGPPLLLLTVGLPLMWRSYRRVALGTVVGTFIVVLGLLLVTGSPIRWRQELVAQPAVSYPAAADLAEALVAKGVDCSFRRLERAEVVDVGTCGDSEDGLLLVIYKEERVRDRVLSSHRTEDEGAFVFGPNWSAGPLSHQEASDVIDAVGGTPVGF